MSQISDQHLTLTLTCLKVKIRVRWPQNQARRPQIERFFCLKVTEDKIGDPKSQPAPLSIYMFTGSRVTCTPVTCIVVKPRHVFLSLLALCGQSRFSEAQAVLQSRGKAAYGHWYGGRKIQTLFVLSHQLWCWLCSGKCVQESSIKTTLYWCVQDSYVSQVSNC